MNVVAICTGCDGLVSQDATLQLAGRHGFTETRETWKSCKVGVGAIKLGNSECWNCDETAAFFLNI